MLYYHNISAGVFSFGKEFDLTIPCKSGPALQRAGLGNGLAEGFIVIILRLPS